MKTYLKPLAAKIEKLLPVNTHFTLEDGSQSFVVYPTNHIELVNDFVNIEVATCIYGNLSEHSAILERLNELYPLLVDFADNVEDYASINPVGNEGFRLNWGGVYIDQDSKDFATVEELVSYLKNILN